MAQEMAQRLITAVQSGARSLAFAVETVCMMQAKLGQGQTAPYRSEDIAAMITEIEAALWPDKQLCQGRLTADNTAVYYAHYGDIEGRAYVRAGGFLFQADGAREPGGFLTCAANDPELVLHGRCDLAEAQKQADGNLIDRICGRS